MDDLEFTPEEMQLPGASGESSEIEFEVDYVENMEAIVHQDNVAADGDVAVVFGTGRQTIEEVRGHGMDAMSQIGIEHHARWKVTLEFGWKLITLSKARWKMITMFGEPTVDSLTITVFEAWIVFMVIAGE